MKISIVTATFNSSATVADALMSVSSQSYGDVEQIVVDGGSTDNTLVLVKKCGKKVSNMISEPDKGIYDAMNKGVALAGGDIVGILNSDDVYADNSVLAKVAEAFEDPEIALCYGDLVYVSPVDTDVRVRVWKSSPYREGAFLSGWVPPHPAFFVRKNVYEKFGGFDLAFPLAADYELMLRFLHCHKLKSVHIPEILVKMRLGGATNKSLKNILRQNKEIFMAGRKNGLHLGLRFLAGKIYDRVMQYRKAGLK